MHTKRKNSLHTPQIDQLEAVIGRCDRCVCVCVHKNLQNLRARNRKFTEVLMIRKGLGGMLAKAGNYAGTLLLTTQKPQINPYKPCKKPLEEHRVPGLAEPKPRTI